MALESGKSFLEMPMVVVVAEPFTGFADAEVGLRRVDKDKVIDDHPQLERKVQERHGLSCPGVGFGMMNVYCTLLDRMQAEVLV